MKMSILKVHYFLWFGSLSGIMPFVPIFAKSHSVATAESVGILYFVLPFIVCFIKPIFCSIADRNNAHKIVLITSTILTITGYGLLITCVFINFGSFSWYWFCILVLMANSGQGIVISLTDYLVMKEATETNRTFGEYRVWGTIGWGGFGLIAGVINEYIIQLPYLLPGLLLFILIESIDLFCICYKYKGFDEDSNNESETNLEMMNNPHNQDSSITTKIIKSIQAFIQILYHIFSIFRDNPSIIQYIIVVLIFGCLTAFHWNFYFWFVEEIRGHDPLLLGLALFVQSFIGELPIFMTSNRILRYCGASISLNISLLAFAVRYFYYGYFLQKGTTYWDILIIESVQGLTFSLFYTVMTDLAQDYANQHNLKIAKRSENSKQSIENSETESNKIVNNESSVQNSFATMQGIMGGTFEGLGLGIGSIIGGYVIEIFGVFNIWRYGAFIAVLTIVLNIIIDLLKKIYNNRKLSHSS